VLRELTVPSVRGNAVSGFNWPPQWTQLGHPSAVGAVSTCGGYAYRRVFRRRTACISYITFVPN